MRLEKLDSGANGDSECTVETIVWAQQLDFVECFKVLGNNILTNSWDLADHTTQEVNTTIKSTHCTCKRLYNCRDHSIWPKLIYRKLYPKSDIHSILSLKRYMRVRVY